MVETETLGSEQQGEFLRFHSEVEAESRPLMYVHLSRCH